MFKVILVGASLLGFVSALPPALEKRATIPTANGFPNPSPQQILSIETAAHGTLPNTPPPPAGAVNNDTLTSLQLIVFNEEFETAYFNSFLHNVTNNVTGFAINDVEYRTFVIKSLKAIIAQEEVHTLFALSALKSQNATVIQPCGNYTFPTTTFLEAVTLAQTFTDVVLGTLQSVTKQAATAGLIALTGQIGSIIAQEGEQVGAFRVIQKKIPSAQPLLTASSGAYAWTVLQSFTVPGTCPSVPLVNLPIFAPLNVLSKPTINSTSLEYSFDLSSIAKAKLPMAVSWSASTNFSQVASVVYVSGQNTPLVVPIRNSSVSGSMVTFTADFPAQSNLFYGLTLASVVSGTGPFASIDAAVNQTVFAPGLIEIE